MQPSELGSVQVVQEQAGEQAPGRIRPRRAAVGWALKVEHQESNHCLTRKRSFGTFKSMSPEMAPRLLRIVHLVPAGKASTPRRRHAYGRIIESTEPPCQILR